MVKVDGKGTRRFLKVLVLVVLPLFSTGCAQLGAIGSILSSLGGLLGGLGKLTGTSTASGATGAVAPRPPTTISATSFGTPFFRFAPASPIQPNTQDRLLTGN